MPKQSFLKLGIYLKDLRTAAGFSQGGMGKALGYSTPQLVSNWERGMCKIPLAKINDFATLVKFDSKKLKEHFIQILVEDYERELREELFPTKPKNKKSAE